MEYKKDIESELMSILSKELTKSINRDILKSMGFDTDRWERRKKSINKIYQIKK